MAFPDRPLRLGTRASPLALRQAEMARAALLAAHGWAETAVELVPMVASGDRILDRALAEVGGKALWTKELDQALAEGRIDAAVHSMKDVETHRPAHFRIAAMLPRADVQDRLIGASSIADLPHGARVGTSSPRRTAQLLRLRPDLAITLLRGNVGTRLARIAAGDAQATLLAAAGLDRLGLVETGVPVPVEMLLPAPSQGAVGIEISEGDLALAALIGAVDDVATHHCVAAERALLAALGGDCRSAVAALASRDGEGMIHLRAEIYAADGSDYVAGEAILATPAEARQLARHLLAQASPLVRANFSG